MKGPDPIDVIADRAPFDGRGWSRTREGWRLEWTFDYDTVIGDLERAFEERALLSESLKLGSAYCVGKGL